MPQHIERRTLDATQRSLDLRRTIHDRGKEQEQTEIVALPFEWPAEHIRYVGIANEYITRDHLTWTRWSEDPTATKWEITNDVLLKKSNVPFERTPSKRVTGINISNRADTQKTRIEKGIIGPHEQIAAFVMETENGREYGTTKRETDDGCIEIAVRNPENTHALMLPLGFYSNGDILCTTGTTLYRITSHPNPECHALALPKGMKIEEASILQNGTIIGITEMSEVVKIDTDGNIYEASNFLNTHEGEAFQLSATREGNIHISFVFPTEERPEEDTREDYLISPEGAVTQLMFPPTITSAIGELRITPEGGFIGEHIKEPFGLIYISPQKKCYVLPFPENPHTIVNDIAISPSGTLLGVIGTIHWTHLVQIPSASSKPAHPETKQKRRAF